MAEIYSENVNMDMNQHHWRPPPMFFFMSMWFLILLILQIFKMYDSTDEFLADDLFPHFALPKVTNKEPNAENSFKLYSDAEVPQFLKKIKEEYVIGCIKKTNITNEGKIALNIPNSIVSNFLFQDSGNAYVHCGVLYNRSGSKFITEERDFTLGDLLKSPAPSQSFFDKGYNKIFRIHSYCAAAKQFVSRTSEIGKKSFVMSSTMLTFELLYGGELIFQTTCHPLPMILYEIGYNNVNYLGFDGIPEQYEVLATFPFANKNIKAISIKLSHKNIGSDKQNFEIEKAMYSYLMEANGFDRYVYSDSAGPLNENNHVIYFHSSVVLPSKVDFQFTAYAKVN